MGHVPGRFVLLRPRMRMLTVGGNGSDAMTLRRTRVKRALRVERLGQTAASVCWICSLFVYGISSVGDWLQLCAASAWLLANIAASTARKAE